VSSEKKQDHECDEKSFKKARWITLHDIVHSISTHARLSLGSERRGNIVAILDIFFRSKRIREPSSILDKLGAARAASKASALRARRRAKGNALAAKSGNKVHGKLCFNGSPTLCPSQYSIEFLFV